MAEYKKRCGVCGNEKHSDFCDTCKKQTPNKHLLGLADGLKLSDSIRGKHKRPGIKRFLREFFFGYQDSANRVKYPDGVERFMDVNREKDRYDEKVIDKRTGKVTRDCHERLSDHRGRGSAKNAKR